MHACPRPIPTTFYLLTAAAAWLSHKLSQLLTMALLPTPVLDWFLHWLDPPQPRLDRDTDMVDADDPVEPNAGRPQQGRIILSKKLIQSDVIHIIL